MTRAIMRMCVFVGALLLGVPGIFLIEHPLLRRWATSHVEKTGQLPFDDARGAPCRAWGNPLRGIYFGLHVDKTSYAVGEPVTLTTCVYNSEPDPQLIDTWEGDSFAKFYVLAIATDGRLAPQTDAAVAELPRDVWDRHADDVLLPHELRASDIELGAFVDVSRTGAYDVIVARWVDFGAHHLLFSNTFHIDIRPA